jgi:hypothetical protein
MCCIYPANHPGWPDGGSLKPPWPTPDADCASIEFEPVVDGCTYHDDGRRFFTAILVGLPIGLALWALIAAAIILGIAKTGGH